MSVQANIRTEGYPATLVAREFLKLAEAEGRSLTQLQLMKMTYIAHGYSLSTFDRPLVSEEVQAWVYGPVFKSLYKMTKKYGRNPVEKVLASPEEEELGLEDLSNDPDAARLIEIIYNNYKKYSGPQLIEMTHRPDTPWNQSAREAIMAPDTAIPNETIKAYYAGLDKATGR